FALEIYDQTFCAGMAAHFEEVRQKSRRITRADIENRPIAYRLRDGFFKLFSPFL
ncbi:MAG: cardiolipin synthase, partial [Desulfuromonadales bacterium]|nr:cardiolipin synthase [Desulfuromonadales bacterium]NIS42596.1 cardiolipin synthase [Desulfuromonadales bacterium]